MLAQIVSFLLVGRLVIFVLQKFPFRKVIFIGGLFEEGKFLEQLFSCSLCLGVWVYAILGYFFSVDFVAGLFGVYIVAINEIITGMIASFVVYIFCIGWTTRFGIIEVN